MARHSRIPKSLDEKIRDLDHHQFLLREGLHGLSRDPAYLKSIAAELRTLVCYSSGTEGLLWRIANELNVSDTILLEAAFSVNKDQPITAGLRFATIPLNRPGTAPPGITPELHSLKEIIKEYEAVHLSSFRGIAITHEYLIKAIAQQMGSAHEDDGVEPNIRRLQRLFFNGTQPYTPVLAFDAELALQVGERVLDHCENNLSYQRARREKEPGNVTLIVRCARVADLAGAVPLLTFRSEISEIEIRCVATPASFVFSFFKRNRAIDEVSLPFDSGPDLTLFAVCYSSTLRQVRVVVNDVAATPLKCDLGWLDAREIAQPMLHSGQEGFVRVDWAFAFERLLSPAHCGAIRAIPTSEVADSLRQRVSQSGFPD